MARGLQHILVATDLSPAADAVVAQAAALAGHTGARLHVLHVVEGSPTLPGTPDRAVPLEALRKAERSLHEQLSRCAPKQAIATREVRVGVPHAAIAARQREIGADLIVIGPHAGRGFRARLLGTTADRVLREAAVPCLVVRRSAVLPWTRVAVPTDLSVPAAAALAHALAWAPQLGGADSAVSVTVVHVGWTVERESDAGHAGRLREALVREATRTPAGESSVSTELLWGNEPVQPLVRWARRRGIELLVVPTHGQGGYRRALLGSTSFALVRHASCSVLLVPAGPDAERRGRVPALDRVVIGVDFSEPSNAAAAWATRHFAPNAVPVLVHAIDGTTPPKFLEGDSAVRAQAVEEARERAERRMQGLLGRLDLPAPRCEVREGSAAEVLAATAQSTDADLIVVGQHTHPRGVWGVLGTTAERLVRCGPVPVLVARSAPETGPRRILAAIDASDHALPVLAWAGFLAREANADLAVCHVLNPAFLGRAYLISGIEASRRLEQGYREQGERWVRDRLTHHPDLGVTDLIVSIGDAAHEILGAQTRDGFDLIVIGSRGEGALARGLLGSVTSAVLRGARCPVLVVREGECPGP